ncbi:MAG: hypothetical protein OEZ25_00560 [Candidatus Bathyarchaeota archaeon]|nr:hypothetical protein [Candidatus Bathyarchaeota archaeon]
MKIKKKSEKYNPILKRKEVTFAVNHPSSGTPLLFEIRKALASMNNVRLDSVYISKMYTLTGTNQTIVRTEIYDAPEAAKLIVPKHIQMRNLPPGEKGEEAKATKKKVSKPAKKG